MTEGLKVRNLTVGYRRGEPVLRSVELHAKRGEITALIGANGSGKSTLIHALLGLVPAKTGSVDLDDMPLELQQRWNVGFCADDLPLPELLTGAEFIRLMTGLRNMSLSKAMLSELFSGLNMSGAERRLVKEYSHGMKRKVQLLANVLHSPDLLVLDEPFRGLDPDSHSTVLGLLDAYIKNGRIVLLSTHDLALASTVCASAVQIDRGVATPIASNSLVALQRDEAEQSPTRADRFLALLDEVEAT